ncbi:ribosome maturation factor RimM [Bacillus sp. HMF5848]|uniref:ribosome maturation factor RimM n=1 Tax=Bacillus sp. HMF5848 TaxID=2495421 RepID=UPI000F7AE065|nr:ribosome maturation factor RimM [Bacillus sp. HMF5848]RSK27006.1 ribosome maturation factor RimM [Bacillus sp. HMF5848]
MSNWFNVGKIVNTHGIAGEVRVISRTDFGEERYKPGNTLYIFSEQAKEGIAVTVKSHRIHKNFDLLSFEEYKDINDVEKLKGFVIKVPIEQLGDLPEGEYYFHEIIGCQVQTLDELQVGEVSEILTPGANDVWVIKTREGKEILIPYIDDIVKKVDVKNKQIWIDPMEGLLT